MEDLLVSTLEQFGYPVRRQGSLAPNEEYPDHFFTFWNNDSSDGNHYDNAAATTVWDFDVNFYSINPAKTYEILKIAIIKLREVGFVISGKGHDVASDEPTHTGRGTNAFYLE